MTKKTNLKRSQNFQVERGRRLSCGVRLVFEIVLFREAMHKFQAQRIRHPESVAKELAILVRRAVGSLSAEEQGPCALAVVAHGPLLVLCDFPWRACGVGPPHTEERPEQASPTPPWLLAALCNPQLAHHAPEQCFARPFCSWKGALRFNRNWAPKVRRAS